MIKYLSEERGEYYDHTGKPTSREAAFEMMDQCVMYMGAEETLDALVRALGADDVCDAFAYIFRNYEIPYPGEEEDEDEEPNIILAKVVTDENGETDLQELTDEEFEKAVKVYESLEA